MTDRATMLADLRRRNLKHPHGVDADVMEIVRRGIQTDKQAEKVRMEYRKLFGETKG